MRHLHNVLLPSLERLSVVATLELSHITFRTLQAIEGTSPAETLSVAYGSVSLESITLRDFPFESGARPVPWSAHQYLLQLLTPLERCPLLETMTFEGLLNWMFRDWSR